MFNILLLLLFGCRSNVKINDDEVDTNLLDGDGDGFTSEVDCNDQDPNIHPEATEICDFLDNDCDALIDENDDSLEDATIWFADNDQDGHGHLDSSMVACNQPDGYVTTSDDCDDRNDTIHPNASETCDHIDNNCDGTIDEDTAIDAQTWYLDADEDAYGDPNNSIIACNQPDGFIVDNTDCDDTSASINSSISEICDGLDNNCDGVTDEDSALDASTWFADADEDTYGDPNNSAIACEQPDGFVADNTDCDDINNMVNISIVEVCNSIDDNCNGFVDEDSAIGAQTWYIDNDTDGFGDPNNSTTACDQPSGFVLDGSDCDDTSASINSSISEICDGIDNNCDGVTDEDSAIDAQTWYIDNDTDGFGTNDTILIQCNQPTNFAIQTGDCDNNNALVHPNADEICNSIDDNCDGVTDEDTAIDAQTWYIDNDTDGFGDTSSALTQCQPPTDYILIDGDCDDDNASVNPDAQEGCDGVDYNCDGDIDNDLDLDGFSDASCGGEDCNDNDATSYPNAGDCYFADCNEILIAGYSTGSGLYTIDTDGPYNGNPPFDVQCDMTTDNGGWTIIDYNLHPNWSSYFNSWNFWNSNTAGPTQYASPYSWETWFTLDNGNTEYRVSEDCQVVSSATNNEIYKMTGDHYGCYWYNTNCPMVGNQCFECTNPYGTVNGGSCSHFVSTPDHAYNTPQGPSWTCSFHWWNNAPSIGTNGSYCVAFRQ